MKPGRCTDRIERTRSVEREYQIARMASAALSKDLMHNSQLLTATGLREVDRLNHQSKLESTYLIRLFAEFETGLRDYWARCLNKPEEARVRDMIESIAARCRIADPMKTNCHRVRQYRNRLVHAEDLDAPHMELGEARRSLCRFFGFLSPDW